MYLSETIVVKRDLCTWAERLYLNGIYVPEGTIVVKRN